MHAPKKHLPIAPPKKKQDGQAAVLLFFEYEEVACL